MRGSLSRVGHGWHGPRRRSASTRLPDVLSAVSVSLPSRTALLASACSLGHFGAPEAADALFDELLGRVLAEGLTAERPPSCFGGLPAAMRGRLAERLLPGAEELPALSAEAVEGWLLLLHDLPLAVAGAPGALDPSRLCSAIEGLAAELLGRPAAEVPPPALCACFLAASSAAAAPGSSAALARLSLDALGRLDGSWARLRPCDVQLLFRSPGDVSEAARRALARIGEVQSVRTQIAILLAAEGHADAAAGFAAVAGRLRGLPPAELCGAEAALRRGGPGEPPSGHAARLLSELREHAFRATLRASVPWCRTPARGYVR
ncbi:unnamed protein product, partial [Prorocentrum cordatum]